MQILKHIDSAMDELSIEHKIVHFPDMVEANQNFQPVATLFFHPNVSLWDYKAGIDQIGGHKILWDLESPYEIDLVTQSCHTVGYCFMHDKNSAEYVSKIAHSCTHVPHACNPKVHRKVDVPYEYRSDLVFVGNALHSRTRFLESVADSLKDYMVTIIGWGFHGMSGYEHQRVIHGHVGEEEMVKYISGAKIALNMHRLHDLDMHNKDNVEFSSPNNRTFEIAGIGTAQMVDHSRMPELLDYFDKDDICVFDGPEDFMVNFRYLMDDPDERHRMVEACQKRAYKDHTYTKRLSDHLVKILWND